jgi:hypothetical protein
MLPRFEASVQRDTSRGAAGRLSALEVEPDVARGNGRSAPIAALLPDRMRPELLCTQSDRTDRRFDR